MIEAYPLCWPAEYPRSRKQRNSRFITTLGEARDYVKAEIKRLGATNPIISTNIPLKGDGDLRADWSRFRLEDTGVAVYFTRDGNQVCLCCDSFTRVWDNLRAVGRTIEALRQIDRDGVSDFLNRAFTGFKALPEHATVDNIWTVLDMEPTKDLQEISSRYKQKAKNIHVSLNNEHAVHIAMVELNQAYESALKYAKS